MKVQDQVKQVPFSLSSFVSLLREIASIPARTTSSRTYKPGTSPRSVVGRWVEALRGSYVPLPRGTTVSVLRLLFPEDDTQRKFGLQEALLAQYLCQCLDSSTVFTGGAKQLKAWNQESASGCLGEELLKYAVPGTEDIVGPKSLQEIDALLDALASTSLYSDKSFHDVSAASAPHAKRSKASILRALYDALPATDAAFLTQIILKDLRPLLYAPAGTTTTTTTRDALLAYNTHSKTMLTREQFMQVWDPSGRMLKMYRVRAKLDEAAMGFEVGGTLVPAHPRWGVPVEVPKSAKGRGPRHALELLDTDGPVWAETKYDGERAQIHVRCREDGEVTIKIFSKSRRDSTLDRVAVHAIIKEALAEVRHQDIILDAEMVAFSDESNAIDEFWRIRGLIAHTAHGIRATVKSKGEHDYSHPLDSCPSLHSSPPESHHLALVFFDILLLGNASLLNVPYSLRRSMLENVIHEKPGQAMLAKQFVVSSGPDQGLGGAAKHLREIWAQHIADGQEGLVLKAGGSTYGDWMLPWVKLKKDYVHGYGDTIDLVVIAGSWEKDRARELRVPPSTLTTFYIGVLGNSSQCRVNPTTKPHFVVYFTASYGLSREQLEEFNFWLRADAAEPSPSGNDHSYLFSLLPTLAQPTVVLRTPILVELCGAGFTKSPSSKYYELRFPRITKLFRRSERSFMEGLTLRELQTLAYESVGREIRDANKYKDLDDWAKRLWGYGEAVDQEQEQDAERRLQKQASTREVWESKFEDLDMQRAKSKKRKHEDMGMSP